MIDHVEPCYAQFERPAMVHGIVARFRAFGVDPRCVGCDGGCPQAANPHYNTLWECAKNPGPLTAEYWSRRLRKSNRASLRRTARAKVESVRQGVEGATLAGNAPDSSPASPSNGKEVA